MISETERFIDKVIKESDDGNEQQNELSDCENNPLLIQNLSYSQMIK